MKFIGDSISEAIDWTQDKLGSTRPFAERTLFSMLKDSSVKETDEGFMLIESEQEDEQFNKHHMLIRNQFNKNRFKFHVKRKTQKSERMKRYELKHLDDNDAADDMMNSDNDTDKNNAIL